MRTPQASFVGVDVGITRFATLSDGTVCEPINSFKKQQQRLARYQRAMSRKTKFSNNWKKAKAKVTKLHQKIGNIRRDYLHKTTTTISQNHAMPVEERCGQTVQRSRNPPKRRCRSSLLLSAAGIAFLQVGEEVNKANKVRPIAVTTSNRLKVLPDVPTVAEAGFPDFHVATWFGLAVKKEVPDEVTKKLHDASYKVITSEEFRNRFEALGLIVQ